MTHRFLAAFVDDPSLILDRPKIVGEASVDNALRDDLSKSLNKRSEIV